MKNPANHIMKTMTHKWNIICAALLALASVGLTACSDDEQADFTGDPTNYVFFRSVDQTYVFAHTPVLSISSLDYTLPLYCNRVPEADFTASVEIDNSLVAAYNEQNGTQYQPVPATALTMENATVRFEKGKTTSVDALHITASDQIGDCRQAEGYLIPLRITSADGNAQVSEENATAYVIVNVKEDFDNLYDDPATPKGALVEDRSAWVASAPGTTAYSTYWSGTSREIDCMFTSFTSQQGMLDYWNGRSSSDVPLVLTVDLGQSYTFDGILATQGPLSTTTCWAKDDIVEVSADNAAWEKVGTLVTNNATQTFYAPVTARYIRVTVPILSQWVHYVYFRCGNFNIYAK